MEINRYIYLYNLEGWNLKISNLKVQYSSLDFIFHIYFYFYLSDYKIHIYGLYGGGAHLKISQNKGDYSNIS